MKHVTINVRWIINVLVLCVTIAGILINVDGSNTYALSCIVMAVSVMSVFKARKDWYMFTIYSFILYCNYSMHMVFYLHYHRIYGLYSTYIGTQVSSFGLNIFAFFTACMFIIIPAVKGKRQPIRSLTVNNRDNPYLVIADILLMLWILIFAFGTLDFDGIRGGNSSFGEFSTVFVAIGVYFSGKRNILKAALIFMAVLFTLKGFLMGERVAGLQLIMILLFAFYAEKLSLKKLLPPAILLFILMNIIGDQRGHATISSDVVEAAVDKIIKSQLVFDTCYSGWHTSLTILKCLEFSGWEQRLSLFMRFIYGVLYGSNRVEFAPLQQYSIMFFPHAGGSVMPFAAYFYLGIPGVILLCSWLGFLFRAMKNAFNTDNGFIRCMAVYITCSVPRWYLYGMFNITRTLMLMAIGYFIFDYTDRAMKLVAEKMHKQIRYDLSQA